MRRLPAYLPSLRESVVVALVTLVFGWLLHLATGTPFGTVMARIAPVAALQLLAYAAAGAIAWRRLRPSAAQLLAVACMAPLASYASFFLTEGRNALAFLKLPRNFYGSIVLVVVSLVLGLGVAVVALYIKRQEREHQAERVRDKLERDLLDMRLRLLQAQIEPHFLFNTLANVQALVEAGSAQAAPVLRHLIDYLRAAMPRLGDAEATLATELQLVRAYLELMRMRMPDRLQFEIAVPAHCLPLRFPAMALLTIVENAVRHGIDPTVAGGRIVVGGECQGPAVVLWVEDDGAGMAESAVPGTGLSNVRTRLLAYFGNTATLAFHESVPHGLRVELHFEAKEAACPPMP